MRKITIYILIVIGICFIIPIFFTGKFKVKEVFAETEETIRDIEEYSYKDFETIKLLHVSDGSVEEKNLDDYIAEVVSAEIPVDFETEAIKAQSVAARTYTLYKITHGSKHANADICDNSSCCQAWISKEDRIAKWEEKGIGNWNKIIDAVNSTIGEVATYEGQIINAFFHSNSGGMTESVANVWGGSEDYPYLQSVETSGEEAYTQYSSQVTLTKEELKDKLKEKYSDIEIEFENEDSIKILEYTRKWKSKNYKIWKQRNSTAQKLEVFLV